MAVHNYGVIKNLKFRNLKIDWNSRENYVGSIVCKNEGKILNCSVSGELFRNSYKFGGIAGGNGGKIVDCEFKGKLKSDRGEVGGITGRNWEDGSIIRCSNSGEVYGGREVGSIASYNEGYIKNCNSDSTVGFYDTNETFCGGLVGTNRGEIMDSYFRAF